jgi:hypothetical protein
MLRCFLTLIVAVRDVIGERPATISYRITINKIRGVSLFVHKPRRNVMLGAKMNSPPFIRTYASKRDGMLRGPRYSFDQPHLTAGG